VVIGTWRLFVLRRCQGRSVIVIAIFVPVIITTLGTTPIASVISVIVIAAPRFATPFLSAAALFLICGAVFFFDLDDLTALRVDLDLKFHRVAPGFDLDIIIIAFEFVHFITVISKHLDNIGGGNSDLFTDVNLIGLGW